MILLGFFLFLSILIIVTQTTLLQLFPGWLGRPDFLYILVVFAAYRFNWVTGLLFVFMVGWMLDVVSGIQLGLNPLQNIIVFASLKLLTENSPLKEAAYQIPLVGVSYFIVQVSFYFLYVVLLPGSLPDWSWSRMIQETIILIVATIPAFVVFNYFFEIFSKRRVIHKVMRKRSSNEFR